MNKIDELIEKYKKLLQNIEDNWKTTGFITELITRYVVYKEILQDLEQLKREME